MLLEIFDWKFILNGGYVVVVSGIVLLCYTVLYNLRYSPLASVPGPKIAAISRYYILYKAWAEKRNRLIDQLHDTYGPIVRIGPNEISISDPQYLKEIYVANYDKSSFYGQFGNYGRPNGFSMLTKNQHIQRRKVLNQLYSKSSILSDWVENLTKERVGTVLRELTKSNILDTCDLFHAMAMDTITGFIFGPDMSTQFVTDKKSRYIVQLYRKLNSDWFWVTSMPEVLSIVTSKEVTKAAHDIEQWNFNNFNRAMEVGQGNSKRRLSPVLQKLQDSHIFGLDACSEVEDHVSAGHETTGATMGFLTWHLSRYPDIQRKLQLELDMVLGPIPSSEDLNIAQSYKDIDALPYLHGVFMETLRIYSAIPGSEPRVVPNQGMPWRFTDGTEIIIPPGTIVSMQPWTLHRDASVFRDPLEFKPERWIDCDSQELKTMMNSFMAFGSGVRMCIGMHLATQEIKLAIAAIYHRYSTTVADGFADTSMEIVDKYTIHPKNHEVMIQFNKRIGN